MLESRNSTTLQLQVRNPVGEYRDRTYRKRGRVYKSEGRGLHGSLVNCLYCERLTFTGDWSEVQVFRKRLIRSGVTGETGTEDGPDLESELNETKKGKTEGLSEIQGTPIQEKHDEYL